MKPHMHLTDQKTAFSSLSAGSFPDVFRGTRHKFIETRLQAVVNDHKENELT